MNKEEKYLDFELNGFDEHSDKDGTGYYVKAIRIDEFNDIINNFVEYTFISGTASATKYAARYGSDISNKLAEITFSKAKARIALQLFDDGKSYEQKISTQNIKGKFEDIPDIYIQKWLLKALYNLKRLNPHSYKKQQLNVEGFCHIFSISNKQYLLSAGILEEKGFIDSIVSSSIAEGILYITAEGIDYLSVIDNKQSLLEVSNKDTRNEYEYDVAISFAGENREIARNIAESLKAENIKVFFDEFEKEKLWGSNLYDYLSHIYTDAAKFCIILISKHYKDKSWTNLERQNAQARAFRENQEYSLPLKLDDTKLLGLPETVGYLSYPETPINEIIELVKGKLISY